MFIVPGARLTTIWMRALWGMPYRLAFPSPPAVRFRVPLQTCDRLLPLRGRVAVYRLESTAS